MLHYKNGEDGVFLAFKKPNNMKHLRKEKLGQRVFLKECVIKIRLSH